MHQPATAVSQCKVVTLVKDMQYNIRLLNTIDKSNRAFKLFNIRLYATLCFNYFR